MTALIKPKLYAESDYQWTFFADLEVSVLESNWHLSSLNNFASTCPDFDPTDESCIDPLATKINELRLASPQKNAPKKSEESVSSQPESCHFGHVTKTHIYSDRRYNPIIRDWRLDDLIARLELVASFGPVAQKATEDFADFIIERTRPEDKVVTVNPSGIYWNEWSFEPLYQVGRYEILPAAIAVLKEVQRFVQSQGH